MSKLSIVIPCYNEAANIPALVDKLETIQKKETEIILVDNGSTDETAAVLTKELVDKQLFLKTVSIAQNIGYGHGIKTGFKDLRVITHKRYSDVRGYLREIFIKKIINWDKFIFEYATISKKNVLRGFHFQSKYKQAKFVSVLKGKIIDCVVDLRRLSKTYGKSFSIIWTYFNDISLVH